MGQILFFLLEDKTGRRTPQDMREIQDWLVKFNVQTVKGVTEVLSLGGEVKQFQVQVRPDDLLRYGVSLPDIKRALEANNNNAGAQYIVRTASSTSCARGARREHPGPRAHRVKTVDGTPVYLRQVAEVVTGGRDPRGPRDGRWQGRGGGRHDSQADRHEYL
jgi:cobalt-zinc-cadmium resistance protein CzcA